METIPQLQTPTKEWNDRLEAIQFLTQVMSQFPTGGHGKVTSDWVLSTLNDKQKEYVIEQTKLAFALLRCIPDKTVSKRIFDNMMVEVMCLTILNRNVDKNTLLHVIGESRPTPDLDETIQKTNLLQNIAEKFKKKEPEREAPE